MVFERKSFIRRRMMISSLRCISAATLTLLFTFFSATAQTKTPPMTPDIPEKFTPPRTDYNYTVREVMVPMRDGVKLYTIMVIPNGVHHAPILLTRTPYNAAGHVRQAESPYMGMALGKGEYEFVKAGYIRVFQDTRGKFNSEGTYVMTTPPTGPLNPDGPNDTTDAWDAVDWLSKNVPESNGKVGMVGISYEGYTVVMALLHPNPALKVAVPENHMVDGWMGDDWFHYGAFRQKNFDFFTAQTGAKSGGPSIPRLNRDDYTNFLESGSAGDFARSGGLDQLPFWRKIVENPNYDAFWREQALDRFIAKVPLTVPTMWVQGLWDQEDMYGAIHCYAVEESKDTHNDMNYLVMGPWSHGEEGGEAYNLGAMVWNGDTGEQFRSKMMLPFLNQYLMDGAPKANTPAVTVYNTGENHWEHFSNWPLSCDKDCANQSKPLYLQADGKLSFTAPEGSSAKYDEYVSDPSKPVPFSPRPYYSDSDDWRSWLVHDQRFVDGRPDVLTWETAPLTESVRLSGTPQVSLYASTSGTDSDWAVKLIDVYPGQYPPDPTLGGYELPIATDIFRGRYRTSFEHAEAITPNKPLLYQFAIPNVNHVFEPGHRIMVQVQSTLFPAYDRNPQTFVPNIFNAKPADYQKAVQRIWHTPEDASFISLPVVPAK
jgi:uncharacterized protein